MDAWLEDLKRELWFRKRERGEIVWTAKDGKEIPIKDMTDQHLANAIGYLEKKAFYVEHLFDMNPFFD